jgi:hypothetical protein
MGSSTQTKGLIVGCVVGAGVLIGSLLFFAACFCNRGRRQGVTGSCETEARGDATSSPLPSRGNTPEGSPYYNDITKASHAGHDQQRPPRAYFVPVPPDVHVPAKAAKLLGLADDQRTGFAELAPDARSVPQPGRETVSPSEPTMDDAFKDLARELLGQHGADGQRRSFEQVGQELGARPGFNVQTRDELPPPRTITHGVSISHGRHQTLTQSKDLKMPNVHGYQHLSVGARHTPNRYPPNGASFF